jgi:hypothetical protein
MGTLRAGLKGLAAALTALCCSTPDSSALFRPAEAESIRTETPGIQPSPGNPSGDAGTGVVNGAAEPSPAGEPSPPPIPVSISGGQSPEQQPEQQPIPSPPTVMTEPPNAPRAPDAGSPQPSPPDPPPIEPECGGALLDGICWYLGELDQACDSVCASHGGFDPSSTAWTGTPEQGGSIEACAALLEALGEPPASVTEGFREDELGFGCHLFVDEAGATSAWWLTAPAFSPAVSNPSARLVCGCAG